MVTGFVFAIIKNSGKKGGRGGGGKGGNQRRARESKGRASKAKKKKAIIGGKGRGENGRIYLNIVLRKNPANRT